MKNKVKEINKNRKRKETIIIIIIIYKVVDFAVPADNGIKLKECEKKDEYLDLGREVKTLWNMKVTIIPIVIRAFGTVSKGLLKGLKDWKFAYEWTPSKLQHY